jgi:HK97 gp10 family phage protein
MRLEGFEELSKKLQDLPDNVTNRVLQKAVTGSIRAALRTIKASAPVGRGVSSVQLKYGYKKLKKSLKVKRLKPENRYERASKIDTGNAFWARFYELGTKKQPARPFFAPAFRRSEKEMIDELAKRIGEGIQKEALKK